MSKIMKPIKFNHNLELPKEALRPSKFKKETEPGLILMKLRQATEEALKAHADLAYDLGIYYGYPECCRTEFCSVILNSHDPSERNIDGSGFIPCRKHYNEIMLGQIKLSDLIKDRICVKPFKP